MSRKAIDRFIKDVQKLEDRHGVRIGFITLDDGKKQLCSCCGIDSDDPLLREHLMTLYVTLDRTRPDND